MRVTYAQVRDLQAVMSGAVSCNAGADGQGNSLQRYHVGSVWYGDWCHKADEGRFGNDQKSNHNAIIRRRSRQTVFFGMAPVTSQDRTDALCLPAGMIHGGKWCQSYVMTNWNLRASRQTLDQHFEYKGCLPPQYVEAMQHHGGG